MKTRRVTFEEVSIRAKKQCKCTGCGKRLTRSKKFWQTLSPFNTKAAGVPKEAADIRKELMREVELWQLQGEMCEACA